MKLGISYNLFDGKELLESSIKSVRNEAFHINVVYQTTSYYGNKAETDIEKFLLHLKAKGLLDEIHHYNEDFSKPQKHYYERKKSSHPQLNTFFQISIGKTGRKTPNH